MRVYLFIYFAEAEWISSPCAIHNLLFIYLFVCFWLCWVFTAAQELSLVVASMGYSSLRSRASHCSGFSCCRAQALSAQASLVVARGFSSCGSRALECSLSSCDSQVQLLCSMWDLPGPGIKPMSPALAGGFLTTASPGKSLPYIIFTDSFLVVAFA